MTQMPIKLQKYQPSEGDAKLPCWNLGFVKIEQLDARGILGEPHDVETNSWATAGGTEDLWTFEIEDFAIVFLRLRVPYSQMDVHVLSKQIPDNFWDVVLELFPSHPSCRRDQVFDEMRHPDDPEFYYNNDS